MPSPGPAELLADLAAVLGAQGVGWYVFGAQAAIVWGRPRLTADVDATISLGAAPLEPFIAALAAAGFSRRLEGTDQFITTTRVVPLQHDHSGMAVDLVLAGPGLEEQFLGRAISIDVGGVAVPFISPEDLIATKVLAGRAKDIEDVRGILDERRGRLDAGLITTTLRSIEEALGRSDLVAKFENEYGNAQ